jgi:PAS domain S-box-containing protein
MIPAPTAPGPPGTMRILHLEDSAHDAELVAGRLSHECPECHLEHATSRGEFEAALRRGQFDLILSDYTLRDFDGLSALEMARRECPNKPFIFLSGTIGEERAIEALKSGATDYVIKDRPSRLAPAIRQALSRADEEQRLRSTEDALLQNRERFRQITENVADLVLMLDLSGRCLYCNPAYGATVGREQQPADLDLFADVHPDDCAEVQQLFHDTIRTGKAGRAEYRLVRPDESVRYVEAQNSVVRDAAHRISQVLIVARDVTERRAASDQIRQQAELLDRAQDAILMRDLDDRITYWNQSAGRIYGWTVAEAKGRPTTALWNEDPAEVEVARHATLIQGEWMGEMRQRSRAGVDLIMQSRWSLVRGKDGGATGFLVINTDIAEKKRLETQFLRVQRTESIGLLAGGVAHDLNNALVPILVSADLIEPMITDPDGKQFVAAIRTSAQHGADLVRQLLAFARGAAGQQSDLSLRSLLNDFTAFLIQTFPRNVAVTLELARDPWHVRGDATQLKQVLMNLCINSRDAMPDGGTIAIRQSNINLDPAAAAALHEVSGGPHVAITVEDTGTGMPPAVLAKIFDPFFTTKEVGKGTGLGLAAVRGIIKGHQGTLTVESEPRRGTTFRIYLPAIASSSNSTSPIPTRSASLQGNGQCILLVDDDPVVRDILCTLLQTSGYRVLKASSGNEALALFHNHGPEISLVLTDVMMSDGDGFALVGDLRRRNYRVPILVMSGMAGAGTYEEKALKWKVPLLAKPITRDSLIKAVQKALATVPAGA